MRAFAGNQTARSAAIRKPVAVRAIAAPPRPSAAPLGKQTTTARVQYVKPVPSGEELFTYLYEKPDNQERWTNLEQTESEVPVTDLRSVAEPFTLQRNGFQFEQLHVPDDINWDDDDDVSEHCSAVPAYAARSALCCLYA